MPGYIGRNCTKKCPYPLYCTERDLRDGVTVAMTNVMCPRAVEITALLQWVCSFN